MTSEVPPVEGSQPETCECGMPHLGGTEHADECPVGVLTNNPWLARLIDSMPDPLEPTHGQPDASQSRFITTRYEVQTRVLNHLRAEFEAFKRAALSRDMSPEFVDELERLRVENERLREAIEAERKDREVIITEVRDWLVRCAWEIETTEEPIGAGGLVDLGLAAQAITNYYLGGSQAKGSGSSDE